MGFQYFSRINLKCLAQFNKTRASQYNKLLPARLCMSEIEINPKEFKDLLNNPDKELFVLDVRNPSEYREYNISGHLIPFMELPSRLHELPEKDALIVVHCAHGVRSRHAAESLRHAGYINCYSLAGGLEGLKNL